MIRLENITKRSADGQWEPAVLDGLSLQVDEGEFIAITGESGAGKTTLLNILGTLIAADEGQYLIGGERVEVNEKLKIKNEKLKAERLCQLRNKEIGFVYQDHRLLPQFTVLQNILLPTLATKSSSTDEEQWRAVSLMGFMGIQHLSDSPVTQLSGGEKTRVAICRALINQPAILLADEPTGQLDAANAQTIATLFQQVNTKLNTTIIMATHSAEMAKAAGKIYRLEGGKLSASPLAPLP